MYSIDELSAKNIAELQDIAREAGIDFNDETGAQDLIYAILDKQADIEGSKNPLGPKRRRTRIVKKDTDRVYTVNGKEGENFDLKKNRIRIHKLTLHMLGDPEYIQLLVNPQDSMIAIRKSVRKDYLAHRVRYSKADSR